MIHKEISGAEIARRANVSRSAIAHVLAGREKSKRLRSIIAKELHLPYSKLWNEKEER